MGANPRKAYKRRLAAQVVQLRSVGEVVAEIAQTYSGEGYKDYEEPFSITYELIENAAKALDKLEGMI